MKIKIITLLITLAANTVAFSQIKIFSGGNISIGMTNTPTSGFKLHLVGNSVFTGTSSGLVTGSSAAFIRGSNAFSTVSTPDYTWWGNDQTGFFHPVINEIGVTTGNTERFRFLSTGVNCYGNATFASSNSTITSAAYIRGLNSHSSATNPDYTWWGNDQTGFFHPASNTIGITINGSEKFRINSSGNFLFGATTNGGEKFTIAAGNQTGFTLSLNQTGGYGYGLITYANQSTSKNNVVYYNGADKFWVYGSGDVHGAGFFTTSDSRLKENIDTLRNALSTVLSLRGVKYNYKPETLRNPNDTVTVLPAMPPKLQIGFIAQEVENILPEVVAEDQNGFKAVNYQNITALLVEAMKEQEKKINQLEQQLVTCCNRNTNGQNHKVGESNNSDEDLNLKNNSSQINIKENFLGQNKPNPFSVETEIEYSVSPNSKHASIIIFDMSGKLLKQNRLSSFSGSIKIEANEFLPGMYLYALVIDGMEICAKRMILTE